MIRGLELSPHYLVDYPYIALDNLHNLGGDILVNIVRHWDTVTAVAAELDCGVNSLEQGSGIDTRDNEVSLVDCFRALGAGTDADSRERVNLELNSHINTYDSRFLRTTVSNARLSQRPKIRNYR